MRWSIIAMLLWFTMVYPGTSYPWQSGETGRVKRAEKQAAIEAVQVFDAIPKKTKYRKIEPIAVECNSMPACITKAKKQCYKMGANAFLLEHSEYKSSPYATYVLDAFIFTQLDWYEVSGWGIKLE